MSEPELAFQKGHPYNQRWYRHPGSGIEVPSVTSIIDTLSKPALMAWAPKVVAEYVVNQYDDVARRASSDPAATIDFLKGLPFQERDRAGDRGTDVHEIMHACLENRQHVDLVRPEIAEYVKAGRKFLEDWNPEVIAAETTCFGPWRMETTDGEPVGEILYAGTFDMVVRIGDKLWLLDWKTSKGVYGAFALQLNAYANADVWIVKGQPTRIIPEIDAIGVVHLRPDGEYDLYPMALCDEAFNAFLSLIPVYHFSKREAVFMEKPLPKPGRTLDQEVYDWLYARAAALPKGALYELAEKWPAGIPTFKQHRTGEAQMVDRHLDAITVVMDDICDKRDLDYPMHPRLPEWENALMDERIGPVIDIGTTKVDRERILLAAFGDRETAFAEVKAAAKRIGAKTPRSFNGCLDIHEAVAEALLTQHTSQETPA